MLGNRKTNMAGASTVTFGNEELANIKTGQKKQRRTFGDVEEEIEEEHEEEYARRSCKNQA